VTRDWRQWWEVNLYGSAGDFRGRKGDLYEGGIRVPQRHAEVAADPLRPRPVAR
jgi:hypothetical protein